MRVEATQVIVTENNAFPVGSIITEDHMPIGTINDLMSIGAVRDPDPETLKPVVEKKKG